MLEFSYKDRKGEHRVQLDIERVRTDFGEEYSAWIEKMSKQTLEVDVLPTFKERILENWEREFFVDLLRCKRPDPGHSRSTTSLGIDLKWTQLKAQRDVAALAGAYIDSTDEESGEEEDENGNPEVYTSWNIFISDKTRLLGDYLVELGRHDPNTSVPLIGIAARLATAYIEKYPDAPKMLAETPEAITAQLLERNREETTRLFGSQNHVFD